jgi:hypothetical protein
MQDVHREGRYTTQSPVKVLPMLKSRSFSSILVAAGIVAVGIGCSSAPDEGTKVMLPTTGGMPSGGGTGGPTGGTGVVGGSGGAGPTAGTTTGGMVNGGSGGAAPIGGSGGGAGPLGGSGGSSGSGGGGGTGGGGEDPNKVVLLDNTPATFAGWKSVRTGGANPWKNNGDGTMTVSTNTGDIQSTEAFNDVFVHLEYMSPRWVTDPTDDQQRGNSGAYLKGSYEVQILNTFGMAPANDRCGAIYGVSSPLETACFDAEEWNTYEIEFKSQTCNGNQKTANARFISVKLNGKLVQENVDVPTTTQAGQDESCDPKGILLQDHSTVVPVTFRNIWVIPRN